MAYLAFRTCSRGIFACCILSVVFLSSLAARADPFVQPQGDFFQVNGYTLGDQSSADVAMGDDGQFVVVWRSGSAPGITRIRGQRFDAAGATMGAELVISGDLEGYHSQPAVSIAPSGEFVVTWIDHTSTYQTGSVVMRSFDASGQPVGAIYEVSGPEQVDSPDVAMGAAGDFLVVWEAGGLNGDRNIDADYFESISDAPDGGLLILNHHMTGDQERPAVSGGGGPFVVTWQSDNYPGINGSAIVAGRYHLATGQMSTNFVVGTITDTSFESRPAVAANANDDFVIAYDLPSFVGGATLLNAVRHGADETVQQSVLPAGTVSSASNPQVAMKENGDFVVTWQDGPVDLDGRVFSTDASQASTSLEIQAPPASTRFRPAVAVAGERVVVVSYGNPSPGDDDSGLSVQGRRFEFGLFGDGFESGNFAAWSAIAP